MGTEYVTVYNQAGELLAELTNAGDVGYNLVHNDLWTASFTLPANDPNKKHCAAHNLVHIPDYGRELGLYRIIAIPSDPITAREGYTTYQLEHVMATLLDDPLFGYHEIGGPGITTAQVIRYILSYQTTPRWVLRDCDFTDQFAYKFENVGLLSALLSLGEVLVDDYTWVFDTSVTPWEVSLKRADSAPGCGIHYKRNMGEIEKAMDATTLVTRLYLLGYGEGVNQLTVKDVNGGKPYIEADTIGTWGVKGNVFVDTRLEDADTLLARGRVVLEGLKNPYISYTAAAIDLSILSKSAEWDRHMPGKLVRAQDDEHGLDFDARIVSVSKGDARGRPGDVDITIANTPRDTADSINTLADRVGIGELYSQGATNLYSQQYSDNADAAHPAKFRIYVPGSCVRINAMQLIWELEAFRAYETGASAGGASVTTTSSGGNSTQTSSAGGQQSISEPQTITSVVSSITQERGLDGSADIATSGVTLSTNSLSETDTGYAYYAGVLRDNTGSAGGHSHTGPNHRHTVDAHSHGMGHFHRGPSHSHSGPSHTHSFTGSTTAANGHTHSIASPGSSTSTGGVSTNATHSISISGTTGSAGTGSTGSSGDGLTGGAVTSDGITTRNYTSEESPDTSFAGTGSTGSAGDHVHPMQHTHTHAHYHTTPFHGHTFHHTHDLWIAIGLPRIQIQIEPHTHTTSIPSHSHGLTLGSHTHDILYGIYEGSTASKVAVRVDGVVVPETEDSGREIDVAKYLSKNTDGKITRGAWHIIELIPDRLTRIEANLFVQTFIQSRGGGDL